MKSKKITSFISLLIATAVCAFAKPSVLTVDLDEVLFEDFLGVNAVYQAFAWMPESKAKGFSEADVQRELDRVKRMELNIARTYYSPDFLIGEGNMITGPLDWESPHMQAMYKWLAAMKEMNVDVALQAGWGFPQHTHAGYKLPDPERDAGAYAAWVSESVHQMVNVRGFDNIKYLILMTEPTTSPWAERPKEKPWPDYALASRGDGETFDIALWPYYVKMMRGLHDRMVADGTRELVQFVGPNNHGVNAFEALRLSETLEELADILDIYGAHTYLAPPVDAYEGWKAFMDKVRETLAAHPLPIWLDEYNVLAEWGDHVRDQPAHGTYIAEVVAASLDAKIATTMIWSLFDQQYTMPRNEADGFNSFFNGIHRWGTTKFPADTLEDPLHPYPVWYAFAMLSKYLGGGVGTKVYTTQGADGMRINAIQQVDGSWRFLVINSNPEPKSFEIQFSRELQGSLQRHVYDPANLVICEAAIIPQVDKIFVKTGKAIYDRLPAGAVAIYVGDH